MRPSLQITAANIDPALLDLPWDVPLVDWPEDLLAALPRGLSRHVVRFVNLSGRVIGVKEIGEAVAKREYELLRDLSRLQAPSVVPVAYITGRHTPDDEPLNGVLVTEHLKFSLPYRALFRQSLSAETADRLVDALAVLLVCLHLLGFYWGDVSLSNTLFRRDASAFSAYLVDAETGELHPKLTDGQRDYDVDLARVNVIGELMDLQAGGYLGDTGDIDDVIAIGNRIVERYNQLWNELTGLERIDSSEGWKVEERIARLNQLGFSLGEMSLQSDPDGDYLVFQPKVVDAGHYHRQLLRLTGLDVEEEQAHRMLDDMATFQAFHNLGHLQQEQVAHKWLMQSYEPVIAAIPAHLAGKLEAAQVFHEFLEHRWYLMGKAQGAVSQEDAIASYMNEVLAQKEDEVLYLDPDPLTDASELMTTLSPADEALL